MGFPSDAVAKNPPARAGHTRLGSEDPLEKETAVDSSILARKNSFGRGAWWATAPRGCKESDTVEQERWTRLEKNQVCERGIRNSVETCYI